MNVHQKTFSSYGFFIVKGAAVGLNLLVAILFMGVPAQAMTDAHQQGMSLARDIPLPQPGPPENVPGYAGTNLPQSQIRAHDLGEQSFKATQGSEAAQLVSEGFERGEKFVIDPHTDPLIMAGNEVIANPQKALDETVVETEGGEGVTEEVKTCEEAGEETLEECEEVRIVTVPEIKKHKSIFKVIPMYNTGAYVYINCNVITGQIWSPNGHACLYTFSLVDPVPAHLQNRVKSVQFAPGYSLSSPMSLSSNGILSIPMALHYSGFNVPIEITFSPNEEDVTERIANGCEWLEEKVEKGLCTYEEIQVIEGRQTRIINDYAVTRDWWRRKKIYRCHYPAKNDCSALRAKGCYQIKSTCREKVRDTCVVWEQTYQCPSGKVSGKSYRSSNKDNPFCLSGDCADKSYDPNQDFAQAMSHMSVLKEAGEDLRNCGAIFKGLDWRCTRHCVNFKDCCSSKGWGVSLKLASCDKAEETLAELRAKKRCIQVGTYCAEKVLGVCIRKKTTFCCYDTKLAKIIQEQGKRQLGLGFGDPEHPQCQGLTIEQLAKLNFSRIDFSDMLADIVASTKTPNPDKLMSGIQRSMQDRGTLLKIKEKSGDESVAHNEPAKVESNVLKNPSAPLPPPLLPKAVNKQAGANTPPTTTSPQDHQIQGRYHGQF